jgi:hypothetical protein
MVGLKILPDLDGPPPPLALNSDLDLVDSTEVDAVMVTLAGPGAMKVAALDSLARSLDELRRDTTALIVAMGYDHDAREAYARNPAAYFASRLNDVRRVVARLHPDYLLPADEPYGRGARALGRLRDSTWESFLARASRAAKRVDPHVRIGVAASAYDASDSALYAWAAAPGSPVDVVGFTIYPSFRGGFALESRTRAADRWMRALAQPSPPGAAGGGAKRKEQWVFAAGGYPMAHGEASQARAVWGALAWATSRPEIRGLVVADASDYDATTGLRAPDGRMRPAAAVVLRATRGLHEAAAAAADSASAAAAATPTPPTSP